MLFFIEKNIYFKFGIIISSVSMILFFLLCGCSTYKYRGYRLTTDLYELPLAPVASIGGIIRPLVEPDDYHFGYHACWLGFVSPLPFITSEVFAVKPPLPDQWFPPETTIMK